MSQEKSELRKYFKALRNKLSQEEVKTESQKINQNFIKNLLPQLLQKNPQAKFALYLSAYNEVNTSDITKHFIANKIIFSYPKIIAKNEILEFVQYQQNQAFEANKIFPKILEIKNGKKIIPDFIIIPLLAFDKNKNRLGMGGGFFDRSLAHFATTKHEFYTIGLAYDFQLYDKTLPTDNTDKSLDFIVSASDILS